MICPGSEFDGPLYGIGVKLSKIYFVFWKIKLVFLFFCVIIPIALTLLSVNKERGEFYDTRRKSFSENQKENG